MLIAQSVPNWPSAVFYSVCVICVAVVLIAWELGDSFSSLRFWDRDKDADSTRD